MMQMIYGAAAAVCTAAAVTLMIALRRRAKSESRRFMTTMRLSLMDPVVQQACLQIEKSYTDATLTPAAVCAAIVTGEPFLEALFTKELGMSVAAYIDQVRVHNARRIASRDPGVSLESTAQAVGFQSGDAFAEKFRGVTGVPFEEYCAEKRNVS
jgi:transcriptional regulator GlxA family with amidase domain